MVIPVNTHRLHLQNIDPLIPNDERGLRFSHLSYHQLDELWNYKVDSFYARNFPSVLRTRKYTCISAYTCLNVALCYFLTLHNVFDIILREDHCEDIDFNLNVFCFLVFALAVHGVGFLVKETILNTIVSKHANSPQSPVLTPEEIQRLARVFNDIDFNLMNENQFIETLKFIDLERLNRKVTDQNKLTLIDAVMNFTTLPYIRIMNIARQCPRLVEVFQHRYPNDYPQRSYLFLNHGILTASSSTTVEEIAPQTLPLLSDQKDPVLWRNFLETCNIPADKKNQLAAINIHAPEKIEEYSDKDFIYVMAFLVFIDDQRDIKAHIEKKPSLTNPEHIFLIQNYCDNLITYAIKLNRLNIVKILLAHNLTYLERDQHLTYKPIQLAFDSSQEELREFIFWKYLEFSNDLTFNFFETRASKNEFIRLIKKAIHNANDNDFDSIKKWILILKYLMAIPVSNKLIEPYTSLIAIMILIKSYVEGYPNQSDQDFLDNVLFIKNHLPLMRDFQNTGEKYILSREFYHDDFSNLVEMIEQLLAVPGPSSSGVI